MRGSTLMHAGIPVRFLTQDDSVMFHLKRVEGPSAQIIWGRKPASAKASPGW